jgi:hypothetical protein
MEYAGDLVVDLLDAFHGFVGDVPQTRRNGCYQNDSGVHNVSYAFVSFFSIHRSIAPRTQSLCAQMRA